MGNLTAAREKLAEAIEARQHTDARLAAAIAAEAHSLDELIAKRSELAALRQYPDDDPAESYIRVFAEGGDVAELCRAKADHEAREKRLNDEIATLVETRRALAAATSRRRDELPAAERAIEWRAKDVIRASDAAEKLLDGLTELQAEVSRRRAELRTLRRFDLLGDEVEKRWLELLAADVGGERTYHAETHWRGVLEALSRDADAKVGD